MKTVVREATDGRGPQQQKGFTLIEMLAAVLLITLLATSVLVVQGNAIEQAAHTTNRRTAWTLAQRQYGEIQSVDDPTQLRRSGRFEDHPDYSWEMTTTRETLDVDPPPTDVAERLDNRSAAEEEQRREVLRVDLSVTYPAREGEDGSIDLTLYRLPPDDLVDREEDS